MANSIPRNLLHDPFLISVIKINVPLSHTFICLDLPIKTYHFLRYTADYWVHLPFPLDCKLLEFRDIVPAMYVERNLLGLVLGKANFIITNK